MQRPTARYYAESVNWRSPSNPSHHYSGNPTEEEVGRFLESEAMEDTKKTWSSESAYQGAYELTDRSSRHRTVWVHTIISVCHSNSPKAFVGLLTIRTSGALILALGSLPPAELPYTMFI